MRAKKKITPIDITVGNCSTCKFVGILDNEIYQYVCKYNCKVPLELCEHESGSNASCEYPISEDYNMYCPEVATNNICKLYKRSTRNGSLVAPVIW